MNTSKTMTVALSDYNVIIGHNLVSEITETVNKNCEKVFIIATQSVKMHLEELENSLNEKGFEIKVEFVPDAEAAKTAKVWANCLEKMAEFKMTRKDTLIAFGGGCVTDLGGFLASTFMRGIDFINVPTTLLAGVDASVGGKTAINLENGKNLAGTFYNPKGVFFDLEFLKTLHQRELVEGMAEALKMGMVADRSILETQSLQEIVFKSVSAKAKVVEKDFKESGLREILNYGHTFAHAVEKLEDFRIRHGEAVSIGIVFAAYLALYEGKTTEEVVNEQVEILKKAGLPVFWKTDKTLEDVLKIIAVDKKSRGKTLRFIILPEFNQPQVLENPNDLSLSRAFEEVKNER